MENQAVLAGANDLNPYHALGKFFRAYFFTKMSLQMGDLPMSDALKGDKMLKPVYDSQKMIFMTSLSLLEESNKDLMALINKNNTFLSGDMYFGNDLHAWQRVVNTYRLRLLIHLSKKAGDADLKVAQQFASVLSDPATCPIMKSSSNDPLVKLFGSYQQK